MGKGIALSGVPRSDIFVNEVYQRHIVLLRHCAQITSKVWPTRVHNVESSLEETLVNLGTDYLDRVALF